MHLISEQAEPASIFLVAVDPEQPDRVPWQVLAVIRAADAVFFDPDVQDQVLDLLGRYCSREALYSEQGEAEFAQWGKIARMRKLADDGWRVVRLIAAPAGIAAEVNRLEAAGIQVRVLSGLVRGESRAYPERFAVSLTGLAG
jgi:siroheme synthase